MEIFGPFPNELHDAAPLALCSGERTRPFTNNSVAPDPTMNVSFTRVLTFLTSSVADAGAAAAIRPIPAREGLVNRGKPPK
jgi:hypothetical protein